MGGGPAEPSGAPPDVGFAPTLEAAGQGPPGNEGQSSTRTADAGGDQAGSDSSAPKTNRDLSAAAAQGDTATAAVGPQPASSTGRSSRPATGPTTDRKHGQQPALEAAPTQPLLAAEVAGTAAVSFATSAPVGSDVPPPAAPAGAPGALAVAPPAATGTDTSTKPPPPLAPVGAPASADNEPPPSAPAVAPAGSDGPPPATVSFAPPADAEAAPGALPQAPGTPSGSAAGSQTAAVVSLAAPAEEAAQGPAAAATPDRPSETGRTTGPGERTLAGPVRGGTEAQISHATQGAATGAAGGSSSAQAGPATSSTTGGDPRHDHDEAGSAGQPVRLAAAADQTATLSPSSDLSTVPEKAAPQPAGTGAPATTPAAPPPVRLSDLAQAARTAIRITSENGGASARITLHPEDLGSVEIHLRYSSEGISATIRADNPQAAQTLQQAAPDLRRSLEGQGLALLDFDVRDPSGQSAGGDVPGRRNDSGGAPDDATEAEEVAAARLEPVRLPIPGSHIDVLA
jgi:flagellar hook-length control protein FliK